MKIYSRFGIQELLKEKSVFAELIPPHLAYKGILAS